MQNIYNKYIKPWQSVMKTYIVHLDGEDVALVEHCKAQIPRIAALISDFDYKIFGVIAWDLLVYYVHDAFFDEL